MAGLADRKPDMRIANALRNGGKHKMLIQASDAAKKRKPLTRKHPLCIEAISVTCGGQLVHELKPFVKQIQLLHPEWPIHIATDKAGYALIEKYIRPKDRVWIVTDNDVKVLARARQTDHGDRWSKGWIGVKLENYRRALIEFNCGVLQCDSDFIFARALPRVNWNADIVMSTHIGPLFRRDIPEEHGYYNAGIFLTDEVDIAERWIKLYNDGHGGFYEQKLLEKFAGIYVIDLFPSDWNWGAWRWGEDIRFNRRMPTFMHTHIEGDFKRPTPVHFVAEQRMRMMNRAFVTHGKYAFCHCPKTAGSELMRCIHEIISKKNQYQVMNSFTVRRGDWSEEELTQLCHGIHKYQQGNRFIVHNHGQCWSDYSVAEYIKNKWKFFALYRPIRDRLLSYYYWSMRIKADTGRHPMAGPITETEDINEFLKIITTDEYLVEWALPNNHLDMLWFPSTGDGIRACCKQLFHVTLKDDEIKVTNASANTGWVDNVEKGIINEETISLINSLPMVNKWDTFIASME